MWYGYILVLIVTVVVHYRLYASVRATFEDFDGLVDADKFTSNISGGFDGSGWICDLIKCIVIALLDIYVYEMYLLYSSTDASVCDLPIQALSTMRARANLLLGR